MIHCVTARPVLGNILCGLLLYSVICSIGVQTTCGGVVSRRSALNEYLTLCMVSFHGSSCDVQSD